MYFDPTAGLAQAVVDPVANGTASYGRRQLTSPVVFEAMFAVL
jgi:hypothetical protein